MHRFFPLVLVILALAGCDRAPRQAGTPQATEAQQAAARDACIAEALLTGARESAEALEQFGALETQVAGPGRAAFSFARAYEQYAELHHTALVYADSAANHAAGTADSLRHIQAAQSFLPRQPQPGTLEGNVAAAWIRDFSTILADEDHPCHWGI